MESIQKSIVRIWGTSSITGGGFLVSEDYVVTCAHVIITAVPTNIDKALVVNVDFPFLAPLLIIRGKIQEFYPSKDDGSGDIALIKLIDPLPRGAIIPRFASVKKIWGHNFRSFGFPKNYKNGVYVSGKILGTDAAGWLQIEDIKETGFFLEPGFSGCPIWDEDQKAIIGMAVAVSNEKSKKVGFALTIDTISIILSSIKIETSISSEMFMVEDLPKDYIPRKKISEQILECILTRNNSKQTIGLIGPGGYGKTLLARAVCHDYRVVQEFVDGVFWITLGQNPDLIKSIEKLKFLLSGNTGHIVDIETATFELSRMLKNNRIFLVIDDVWRESDIKPFMQGGDNCVRLITTRNRSLISSIADKIIHVGAMTKDEAVALLSISLTSLDSNHLMILSKKLGRWPLLLKLVNATIREHINYGNKTILQALTYVNSSLEKKGLIAFDEHNSEDRSRAVQKTIGLSLAQLTDLENMRLLELSIYPPEQDIPLGTIFRLWKTTSGLDETECDEILLKFFRLSLIAHLDYEQNNVRIHDVIQEILSYQAKSILTKVHEQYLLSFQIDDWSKLDITEEYMWRWLGYHLIAAKRTEEFRDLVKNISFLAKKTFINGVYLALKDIEYISNHYPDDQILREELNSYRNCMHLLANLNRQKDIHNTIRNRFVGIRKLLLESDNLVGPYWETDELYPDSPHNALIRTIRGHEGEIYSCDIAFDGNSIITASSDKTIRLWDSSSGEQLRKFSGHTDDISCCCITPNNKLLFSGSFDGSLISWDVKTGLPLHTFLGHSSEILACITDPKSEYLISCSMDGLIKIWNITSGDCLYTLSGHEDAVNGCCVSDKSNLLISVSRDNTVRIWNLYSWDALATLRGHTDWVNDCKVTLDGEKIITASRDTTIRVWDIQDDFKCVAKFVGHTKNIQACNVDSRSERIVSASWDKTVRVWDIRSRKQIMCLYGHDHWVNDCMFDTSGQLVFSVSDDRSIKIWDLNTVENPSQVTETESVGTCAIANQSPLIVYSGVNGSITVVDIFKKDRVCFKGHTKIVNKCIFSLDDTKIISASNDCNLGVWDVSTTQLIYLYSGHKAEVTCCDIDDQGIVASCSVDKSIILWDSNNGMTLHELIGHTDVVRCCCYSKDKKWILSGSDDKSLRLWRREQNKVIIENIYNHKSAVWSCCFDSVGQKLLVAGMRDGSIAIWDLEISSKPRLYWKGHNDGVSGCVFSDDGKYIITIAGDGAIKMWDVKDGKCLLEEYVDGQVFACDIRQDILVVGGKRGLYNFKIIY
ncbi:MAG: hypothetical protein CL609_22930 [Anaerolineaceae bacterium]|nr:hypothetical protein [Anaerolineaceae bacterium]